MSAAVCPLCCAAALQIAKLLIIPFVCVVELLYMRKRFSAPVVASIAVVIIGVAIV
jgi:solute carrier family 35 protein E3